MPLSDYSGIVINQNAVPEDSLDVLAFDDNQPYYQTFQLPADYARGTSPLVIPALTGLQLYITVTNQVTASLGWELDHYNGSGWDVLASGVSTGTPNEGNVWFNITFRDPVTVMPTWLTDTFRIGISGFDGVASVFYSVPNPLDAGRAFTGNIGGFPSTTNYPADSKYPEASSTPLTDAGRSLSLMFRLLAAVADSGTDFLGDVYRSVAITRSQDSVSPVVLDEVSTLWVSQPSPSAFAVESLYLDMRANGQPVVVDRFTLDPITPGVSFHVYYSNDPNGPGIDVPSWEGLLWTPVYQTYQATRQQTFALPEPITARYIMVEFSNLQGQSYDPGPFELPTIYKKYPQWVLDYFIGIFDQLQPDLLSSGIDITYDALDLAFSYYTGDLNQDPAAPALSQSLTPQQAGFLQQEVISSLVDSASLAQINLNFQPYTNPPGSMGAADSILGAYASSAATSNYPSETVSTALGDTSIVSNLHREALLVEKGFPIMFFYLPCRHAYRIAQATFANNIAYFAGVNSLVFHREIYTGAQDRAQINENLGDGANLLINDWAS